MSGLEHERWSEDTGSNARRGWQPRSVRGQVRAVSRVENKEAVDLAAGRWARERSRHGGACQTRSCV